MNWIPPPERRLWRDLQISLENCGSHRARQQLIMEKRWLRHNRESLRATQSDSHSEGDLRVNDRLTYVCKIFLKSSEKLWLSLVSNKASIQTHSFIQSVDQQSLSESYIPSIVLISESLFLSIFPISWFFSIEICYHCLTKWWKWITLCDQC